MTRSPTTLSTGRTTASRAMSVLVALLALLLVGGACSGDDSGDDSAGRATPDTVAGSTSTSTPGKVTNTSPKKPAEAVTIPSDLLFGFDSAALSPDAAQPLAAALELTARLPKATFAIDGHTDNLGDAAYNQDLSRRRAASVAAWLEEHGVDRARLTVRGMGADHPVADNSTPEGQQTNRRVEITVLSKT
jgi:outer membrane protein OmpA-like peptidoglycan-associated protein